VIYSEALYILCNNAIMQHTEQVMRWLAPFFDFVLCLIEKRSKLSVDQEEKGAS
jgi:hypothetical protein